MSDSNSKEILDQKVYFTVENTKKSTHTTQSYQYAVDVQEVDIMQKIVMQLTDTDDVDELMT